MFVRGVDIVRLNIHFMYYPAMQNCKQYTNLALPELSFGLIEL